jgi:hypothetical protein
MLSIWLLIDKGRELVETSCKPPFLYRIFALSNSEAEKNRPSQIAIIINAVLIIAQNTK